MLKYHFFNSTNSFRINAFITRQAKVLFENSVAYLLGRMGTLGIFELILIDCKI